MIQKYSPKLGAVAYLLWGAFHVFLGLGSLYILGVRGSLAFFAVLADALPPEQLPHQAEPVVSGVIGFYAWTIASVGVSSMMVAVRLNWRNDRFGYWLNMVIAATLTAALFGAHVIPGHMKPGSATIGPSLFALSLVFSTVGILAARWRGGEAARQRAPLREPLAESAF